MSSRCPDYELLTVEELRLLKHLLAIARGGARPADKEESATNRRYRADRIWRALYPGIEPPALPPGADPPAPTMRTDGW